MSLQEIKVKREKVLEIVAGNKQKHDEIFDKAVEGYWVEAEKWLKKYEKERIAAIDKDHKNWLKERRKSVRDQKKQLKAQVREELNLVKSRNRDGKYVYMKNVYPENHADDYVGTIRRLELCVDDEVELDSLEFDRYIRNKWEWRESFLTSNTGYYNTYAVSGSWCSSSYSTTASYALGARGANWGTGSMYVLTSF